MRLTVGPLPPAVYWRRRALVIGIPVLLVMGLVFLFDGGGGNGGSTGSGRGGAGEQPPPGTGTPTRTTAGPTGDPSGAPDAGGATALPSGGSAAPVVPASTSSPGLLCTDAEMELTPYTDPVSPKVGQAVRMNPRSRTCPPVPATVTWAQARRNCGCCAARR